MTHQELFAKDRMTVKEDQINVEPILTDSEQKQSDELDVLLGISADDGKN